MVKPHSMAWVKSSTPDLYNWLAIYQEEIRWRRARIADGHYTRDVVDRLAREIQARVVTCSLIVNELYIRGAPEGTLPDFS